MHGKEIDKEKAMQLLREIGAELKRKDLQATLDIYGGVAVSLTVAPLYSSGDMDVVMYGIAHAKNTVFNAIISKIGEKHGLSDGWLNDGISTVVNECLKTNILTEYERFDNLTVRLPSSEQLLAMKIFAARMDEEKHDFDHALMLCRDLGIDSRLQMERVLKKYVKEDEIKKQNRQKGRHNCVYGFIDELVGELRQLRNAETERESGGKHEYGGTVSERDTKGDPPSPDGFDASPYQGMWGKGR